MSFYTYNHGDTLCDKKGLLNFAVNLNPLGAPKILEKLEKKLPLLASSYPTPLGEGVRYFYAKKFGIPVQRLTAGNGASELIYLLPHLLNIKKALIVVPTFHDYLNSVSNAGGVVIPFITSKESDFSIDLEKLKKKAKETDTVILCNPNNPTGKCLTADSIVKLAKELSEKRFVVDESFVQFTNMERCSLLKRNLPQNIILIHSLTKFYALAGLRMGAMIASEQLTQKAHTLKPPWSINAIADALAPLLLECREYEKETIKLIKTQKDMITAAFSNFKNLRLYTTNANFFLAERVDKSGFDAFLKRLKRKGVCVRDCRNFEYLEGNFFRFAIKTEAENRVLLDALQD